MIYTGVDDVLYINTIPGEVQVIKTRFPTG